MPLTRIGAAVAAARRRRAAPRTARPCIGVVDHADLELAVAHEGDRDAEMRNAAREIGGAVDRVDDPDVAAEIAALFLAEERILRKRREQPLADHALHLGVGFQDVILRALESARARLRRVARTPCRATAPASRATAQATSEAIVEFGHPIRHRAAPVCPVLRGFGRRIGENLRAQAVLAGRRDRRAVEHGRRRRHRARAGRRPRSARGRTAAPDRCDSRRALACSTVVARWLPAREQAELPCTSMRWS